MANIDFERWPSNDHGLAYFKLNISEYPILDSYPKITQHLHCVMRFIYHVAEVGSGNQTFYREAYLRAALMEFVLLEDVLNEEKLTNNEFRFAHSDEPIFHLMKMLRNTQLHLRNLKLSSTKRSFLWGKDKLGQPREHEGTIFVSQKLTEADLEKWRDRVRYTHDQRTELLNWYNKEQYEFGTGNLVYLAMTKFISVLL